MDAEGFMNELIDSYVEPLRPGVDFLKIVEREIKKRPCTSAIYEEALNQIRGAFRLFPGIADIKWAFNEAFKAVKPGEKTATEYFDIGDNSYARPVEISSGGEIIRKTLPVGAANYHLWLPPELQSDKEGITAQQAYAEGCLSEELYQLIANKKDEQSLKGRFKKIGELIHQEESKQADLPIIEAEFEHVDDSMAANPEEKTTKDDYEDI